MDYLAAAPVKTTVKTVRAFADGNKVFLHNITFSASGWAHPVGVDNVANAILIHLARDVEGCVEMFSYYWITLHAEFSRIS